jgi:hypothetical protein
MPFLPRIPSFLRNLTRRRKVEQDLADEVSSYVDLSTQRKMKEGLAEPEARRAALVAFGGIEQVKEQVREVRLGRFLETRWQDLRFAFRTLRKSPVFSLPSRSFWRWESEARRSCSRLLTQSCWKVRLTRRPIGSSCFGSAFRRRITSHFQRMSLAPGKNRLNFSKRFPATWEMGSRSLESASPLFALASR